MPIRGAVRSAVRSAVRNAVRSAVIDSKRFFRGVVRKQYVKCFWVIFFIPHLDLNSCYLRCRYRKTVPA